MSISGAGSSAAPGLLGALTQYVARAGREAQVCDGLLRVAEAARAESDNLGYDLYQLGDRPWVFYGLADWADPDAAQAHLASPPVRDFLAEHGTADLAAPPTHTRARMLSHPDPRADRPRPVPGSDQVVFFPFFHVRSGEVDTVRSLLLGAVDPTRAEDGCLDYDLYQPLDDPAAFFYREHWAGKQVLDRHMNTPGFYKVLRGEVDPRLIVPWSGLAMTMISRPGPIRTA